MPITPRKVSHGADAFIVEAPAFGVRLSWYSPTEENPYWLLRLSDATGEPLPFEGAIGDDTDTALADALEKLMPPEPEESENSE